MGCVESADEDRVNLAIERALNQEAKETRAIHKILLLGCGESGKSTVFKQMRLLYDNEGYTVTHQLQTKPTIIKNVIDCMQTLLEGAEQFDFQFEHKDSQDAAARVKELGGETTLTAQDVVNLKHLWLNEPAIQKTYARRNELHLLDSAPYFLNSLDRIGDSEYLPTRDDFVRSRLRTIGIVERSFTIRGVKFKFIDVGGQRNERRKWIRCFDNVTALIFIVGVSEFDQELWEDSGNRLTEAMVVWSSVLNREGFSANTAYILFLNKVDLFENKILNMGKSLKTYFPEFEGPDTVEDSLIWIREKFLSFCEDEGREIFVHNTTATDTENVNNVFKACQQVILRKNIKDLGLGDMDY